MTLLAAIQKWITPFLEADDLACLEGPFFLHSADNPSSMRRESGSSYSRYRSGIEVLGSHDPSTRQITITFNAPGKSDEQRC